MGSVSDYPVVRAISLAVLAALSTSCCTRIAYASRILRVKSHAPPRFDVCIHRIEGENGLLREENPPVLSGLQTCVVKRGTAAGEFARVTPANRCFCFDHSDITALLILYRAMREKAEACLLQANGWMAAEAMAIVHRPGMRQ